MSRYRWAILIMLLGLALNALTMIYAVSSHRPLMGEGAWWLYSMLDSGQLFYDRQYYRVFSLLFQLPSFLASQSPPLREFTSLITRLFEIGYGLHPLLSLFACAWILARKRKLGFLIFPLASFAVATQSTVAYAIGVVPDALSVFWPLLLLVLFGERQTRAEAVATLAFALALALTYELAVIFFVLMLFIVLARPSAGKSSRLVATAPLVLGIAWFIWLRSAPSAGTSGHFVDSLRAPWGDYRVFGATSALLFGVSALAVAFRPSWDRAVTRIASVALVIATAVYVTRCLFPQLYLPSERGPDLWEAFHARTTAIPVAAFLAGIAWWVQRYGRGGAWESTHFARISPALVGIILVNSALYDVLLTQKWRDASRQAEAHLASNAGCSVSMKSGRDWNGISFPVYHSIIAQQSRVIHSIVFSDVLNRDWKFAEPCREISLGRFPQWGAYSKELRSSRYFDFSPLIASPNRVQ